MNIFLRIFKFLGLLIYWAICFLFGVVIFGLVDDLCMTFASKLVSSLIALVIGIIAMILFAIAFGFVIDKIIKRFKGEE